MNDALELFSVLMVLMLSGAIGWTGFLGIKTLSRRLRDGNPVDRLTREIEELHARLAHVEHEQARVAELEERLDFAERLLAAPQEPERQNGR
jgi:hypothetical protein